MDARARAEINRRVDGLLNELAEEIAADARRFAPVDTGQLRDSIRPEPARGGRVQITADADYAGYVELGTRYMDAQPYLRPALYRRRDV